MSAEDRKTLEGIAFDMAMASMEYNGMEEEVWEETRAASDEDLIRFITEN